MVTSTVFGSTKCGDTITAYTIENAGIGVRLINFGAVMMDLYVPDRDGERKDILLGFDRIHQYEVNGPHFGAVVGPVANRTAKGQFTLDGVQYQLPVNDGPNNLHTDHTVGLDHKVWKAAVIGNSVVFTVSAPDGEAGLPGNRNITVTYTVTDEGAVRIHYHVSTDKKSYINPTNHAYFNLEGDYAGPQAVLDTIMQLNGSHFTPVGKGSIPTGEIAAVEGTPFDFRTPKAIGRDIEADNEQIHIVGGYDHNYCVDGYTGDGQLRRAARAYSRRSGRVMEVYTTLPGIQFYTGNYVDEKDGKQGVDYMKRGGFCLETQFYPDSVNHENFPQPVFDADHDYDSVTEYRFSVQL